MVHRKRNGAARPTNILGKVGRRPIRFVAAAALGLAVILPGGCAVTTIDVDVYKGPLANEDGVQTEQVAALAIAAKPLLVQLRDTLGQLSSKHPPDYRFGFMRPLPGAATRFPDKVHANRVNALLSLYEDSGGDLRANELIAQGQRVMNEVRADKEVLDHRTKEDDTLVAELSRVPDKVKDEKPDERQVRTLLIDGYKDFFNLKDGEPYRKTKDVVRGHILAQNLAGHPIPNGDFPKEFVRGDQPYIARGFSTAVYELLGRRDVVEAHAAVIFGSRSDPAARKYFVEHVLQLAHAFRDWRLQLDKGLTLALQYLEVVQVSDVLGPDERRKAIQSASQLSAELIDYRVLPDELKLKQPTSSKATTTPTAYEKLLQVQNQPDVRSSTAAVTAAMAYRDVREDLGQETRAFALKLFDDTSGGGHLAHDLLKAHRSAPRQMVGQRYGIARGPDAEELPGLDALDNTIRQLQTMAKITTGAGFDRGRQDRGLETLVGEYLRARDTTGSRAPDTLAVERTLHADLVHFSEKLLFVANYDSLLKDEEVDSKEQNQVQQYTRVLQAVGNEILVSVNERRNKRNYDRGGESLGKQEVNAIYGTLPRNTADVLRRVTALLDVEREAAQDVQAQTQRESASLEKQIADVNKSIDALYAKANLTGPDGHVDPDKLRKVPDALKGAQKNADDVQKKADDAKKKVDDDAKAVADAQKAVNAAQVADDQAPFKDPIVARALRKLEEINATPGVEQAKIDEAKAAVERAKQLSRTIALADADLKAAQKKLEDATKQREKDEQASKDLQDQLKEAKKTLEDATATSALVDQAKAKETDRDAAQKSKGEADARLKTATADLSGLQSTTKVLAYYARDGAHLVSSETPKDAIEADVYTRLLHAIDDEIQVQEQAGPKPTKPAPPSANAPTAGASVAVAATAPKPPATPAAVSIAASVSVGSAATATATAGATQPAPAKDAGGAQPGEKPLLDDLKVARKVLSQRHFDQPLIDPSVVGDPRHVVDQLVSTYEYQYLDAVRAGGENGPVALRLRQAIDAAKSYRAGMVHIISPAAFLRSSYPISSLQAGTTVSWENMLARHSVRQTPFLGGQFEQIASGVSEEDAKIIKDLDRQNWQNINRVRVAGGGFTNYVMVKDDIGNWYVKSYVGDPEPIIEGAKALTLFGASQRLGADLLEQDRVRQQALDKGEAPPDLPTGAKAFQREAGVFHDKYAGDTAGQAKKIAATAHTISADLQAAWAGDDAVSTVLLPQATTNAILNAADAQRAAAEKAANEAAAKGVRDDTASSKINAALGSLIGYEKALLAGLAKLPPADDKPLNDAKSTLADQQAKEATAKQADDFAHETVKQAQARLATVAGDQLASAQSALQTAQADAKAADAALQAASDATKAAKAKVDEEQKKYDTAVLAHTNARKIVGDQVGTTVANLIKARASTLNDYQTAMSVLLQAGASKKAATPN